MCVCCSSLSVLVYIQGGARTPSFLVEIGNCTKKLRLLKPVNRYHYCPSEFLLLAVTKNISKHSIHSTFIYPSLEAQVRFVGEITEVSTIQRPLKCSSALWFTDLWASLAWSQSSQFLLTNTILPSLARGPQCLPRLVLLSHTFGIFPPIPLLRPPRVHPDPGHLLQNPQLPC